jgi:hypothetical protein
MFLCDDDPYSEPPAIPVIVERLRAPVARSVPENGRADR